MGQEHSRPDSTPPQTQADDMGQAPSRPDSTPPRTKDMIAQDKYCVEAIVGERLTENEGTGCLVWWSGFDPKTGSTWEPHKAIPTWAYDKWRAQEEELEAIEEDADMEEAPEPNSNMAATDQAIPIELEDHTNGTSDSQDVEEDEDSEAMERSQIVEKNKDMEQDQDMEDYDNPQIMFGANSNNNVSPSSSDDEEGHCNNAEGQRLTLLSRYRAPLRKRFPLGGRDENLR